MVVREQFRIVVVWDGDVFFGIILILERPCDAVGVDEVWVRVGQFIAANKEPNVPNVAYHYSALAMDYEKFAGAVCPEECSNAYNGQSDFFL